jgi:chitin synthase
LQLAATYLAYIFGKFACKVNIQRVSFALPLNLATPVAVVILISLCKIRLKQ